MRLPATSGGRLDVVRIVVDEKQGARRIAKALLGDLVDQRVGLHAFLIAGNDDVAKMAENRRGSAKTPEELAAEVGQREQGDTAIRQPLYQFGRARHGMRKGFVESRRVGVDQVGMIGKPRLEFGYALLEQVAR